MTELPETGPRRSWVRYVPVAVIAVVAVAGWLTLGDYLSFDTLKEHRAALLAYRDAHVVLLAATFVAAYVAIVSFSLPGATVASVTGGFLFGLTLGTSLNVLSATLGAAGLFLAVRWGPGRAMAAKLDTSEGRLRRLTEGLRRNEVRVLFLLRLLPVVPFFVANLLPALVGVKFGNFFLTTALGIIPGALIFTWIGVGVGEVFDRGEMPDLSLLRDPQVTGPILGLCALVALPVAIRLLLRKGD